MSYLDWLHTRCQDLGIVNHEFMDARGMEHMICITQFRLIGGEISGIDQPPLDISNLS